MPAYINVSIIGSLAKNVVDLLARKLNLPLIHLQQNGFTQFHAAMEHVQAIVPNSEIDDDPRASLTVTTTDHDGNEIVEARPVASYLNVYSIKPVCLALGKRDGAVKSILIIAPTTLNEHRTIKSQVDNMDAEFKDQFDEEVLLNKTSYTDNPEDDEDFESVLNGEVEQTMISLDKNCQGQEASIAQHLCNILHDLAEAQEPEVRDYRGVVDENSEFHRRVEEQRLDREEELLEQLNGMQL